jgi:hypothetical protein
MAPLSNRARLRELLDSSGYVLLDGNKVSFSEDRAERISAIIDVPKPDIIRLYRASEPMSLPAMLGNCRDAVVRTPTVAHDILVLSYTKVPNGTAVSLVTSDGHAATLAANNTTELSPLSWIIYSNEETPFSFDFDPAEASDQQYAQAMAGMRHPTTLNDFLNVNVKGMQSAVGTTLQLSGIGRKDGPPANTPIGITDRQLLLFHELPDNEMSAVPKFVSGPGGCSGGALAKM